MRLPRLLSRLEGRLTIRARLTLWYAALLGVALMAFGGLLYWSLSSWLYAQNTALLRMHAEQVAGELEVKSGRLTWSEQDDLATAGTLVAAYDQTGSQVLGPSLPTVFPVRLPPGDTVSGQTRRFHLPGGDAETLTLAVTQDGVPVGWVVVMRSLRTADDALLRLLRLLFLSIPLILLTAATGGLLLARRALAPISRITDKARAISHNNLSERLGGPATPDEVGRLASTLDEMLDRLDQAFERQRQFTADASHELHTPLAIISAQAEEALRRPEDTAVVRGALETIRQQVRRMGKLTSQLLTLARADAAPEGPSERERLDLASLATDVVDEMREFAGQKGTDLAVTAGVPVWVLGDQTGLTELFVNLIDNAIRYTPPGGRVSVDVGRRGADAVVSVADTGPGIPPEDLPRLFERFYRVDKARSHAQGGTGLGLAIARTVARAHGGDIEVASRPGQGATFTVHLPRLIDPA